MRKILQLIEKLFTDATNLIGKLFTGFIYLIIIGIVLWFGWKVIVKVADFIIPDKWTLMVCETKLNDSECQDISYEIPNFKSEKECMLEGATRFSKDGFECGSNCKMSEYGLNVCKKICNKSGCS